MPQARKAISPRESNSGVEWWSNRPLWPHGGTMGGTQLERSLRFGRTKKINEVFKPKKNPAKRMNDKRGTTEKSKEHRKLSQKRDKKRDRKLYPLRGRAGASDGEGLSCHVLLTRLEESVREKGTSERKGRKEQRRRSSHKSKPKKGKVRERKEERALTKTKSKSNVPGHAGFSLVPQPRKRRLASLNAEAVNSLLLERASDPQPAAKQARRQEDPMNMQITVDPDPGRSGVSAGLKVPRGGMKNNTSHKLKLCQTSKQARKASNVREERKGVSLENLDAPAPRRLAGLNAAALLKLTSSSATSKQRVKPAPTATVTSDCKASAAVSNPKQPSRVKLKQKGHSHKQKGRKAPHAHSGCAACKKKADFEPKVEWDTTNCAHRLTKPGYQSRMLAYPLKQVKEEQLETDLSPYYCCPTDGSVEYCHRLAFFLGQQPYRESDDQAMPPVKRECLVSTPSLTHSHPHTALTLSPHPCLCTADHCFSSYYVHIAHPTHAGTASAGLASRSLNFAPSGLCPSRMTGSKLLGPQMSHTSQLAHPAFCNSVTSPCYGDSCGISGYTYRAMPPVTSRGCSFSPGCTGCTHNIKTGEFGEIVSLFLCGVPASPHPES